MQIHAGAELALTSASLGAALREFVGYVRQRLVAGDGSALRIALAESGARMGAAAAHALPAEMRAFGLGIGPMPGQARLTGEEFVAAIAGGAAKRTHLQATFDGPAAIDAAWASLEGMTTAAPDSGRGVMLFIHLVAWRVGGAGDGVHVDATFSRFQKGGPKMGATLGLRFVAHSLSDPIVKATLARVGEALGVRFRKQGSTLTTAEGPPAPDPTLQAPTADARGVVVTTFHEVLARAARQIDARAEDLRQIPLLFGRGAGFDKRMRDVQAGKAQRIDLPSRVKRFMRERFADYAFDAADSEQLRFRKPAAPTLDLILVFDRVHQWGLGKTFTVEWGVDFPDTALGGAHAGWDGTRKSIFWLFHRGWETQVWTYTTADELEAALDGCGRVLDHVLPALAAQAAELLVPVPSEVPAGTPRLGALTARDACDRALAQAREWAPDARLESIASGPESTGRGTGGGLERTGRIRPHASWLVKLVSERRLEHCLYIVPHTGSIWWNFYSLVRTVRPHLPALVGRLPWADSTAVAPRAFAEIESRLGTLRLQDLFLALKNTNPYNAGRFVWEATGIGAGTGPNERKDVVVELDPVTAELLDVTIR